MSIDNLYIVFIVTFLFFFCKRLITSNNNHMIMLSEIDRVELCYFDNRIILPEVRVFYKYYFGKGLYFGKGYGLISDFLDGEEYEISMNVYGLPVIHFRGHTFVGEEKIESFLIRLCPFSSIIVDAYRPYVSEMVELKPIRPSFIRSFEVDY